MSSSVPTRRSQQIQPFEGASNTIRVFLKGVRKIALRCPTALSSRFIRPQLMSKAAQQFAPKLLHKLMKNFVFSRIPGKSRIFPCFPDTNVRQHPDFSPVPSSLRTTTLRLCGVFCQKNGLDRSSKTARQAA